MRCAWCRRDLDAEEARRIPALVKIPASVALAFMHGGMWVFRELSQPFCARCRTRIIPLVVIATILVLAVASLGVAIWLSRPA